jgi:hypothetical protein
MDFECVIFPRGRTLADLLIDALKMEQTDLFKVTVQLFSNQL